jgi:hypothetical protein
MARMKEAGLLQRWCGRGTARNRGGGGDDQPSTFLSQPSLSPSPLLFHNGHAAGGRTMLSLPACERTDASMEWRG